MNVGKNIRRLRLMSNLTQEELAKRLGVSGKTISSWEIGRTEPDIGAIEKLANYFGCQKSEIIGHSEGHYLNEDVREIAQELFDRKELKILFDSTRKIKKEDIKIIQDLVDRLKK